jgi:predicted NACHT family NTPase
MATDPISAGALAGGAQFLKKPAEDLYETGKGKFKNALSRWRNASQLNVLARATRQIAKVKTLWSTDKEVSIASFYYPARLQFGEQEPKRIESLAAFDTTQNYVIQGTVGQGKSIFLRYLCVQELKKHGSGRIPVFGEFRRIEKGMSIQDFLHGCLIVLCY